MPDLRVRDWYERRKESGVLLKVVIANKTNKKVKAQVTFRNPEGNILCPKSFLSLQLLDSEVRCLVHLSKLAPLQDWGTLQVDIVSKDNTPSSAPPLLLGNLNSPLS